MLIGFTARRKVALEERPFNLNLKQVKTEQEWPGTERGQRYCQQKEWQAQGLRGHEIVGSQSHWEWQWKYTCVTSHRGPWAPCGIKLDFIRDGEIGMILKLWYDLKRSALEKGPFGNRETSGIAQVFRRRYHDTALVSASVIKVRDMQS